MATYTNRNGNVNGGYVKFWRQIFDNPAIGAKPYCEIAAWAWIFTHANWDGPHRGTLEHSRRYLARAWGWTPDEVRRFLEKLTRKGMIKTQRIMGPTLAQGWTQVSVCNYEKFQGDGPSSGPGMGPKIRRKKVKKNTTSKEVVVPTPALDAFGIEMAFKAYNALAEKIGLPVASKLTDGRRKAIGARIRDHGPDGWHAALRAVEQSAFLRGQNGGREGWKASLDFVCQASSFQKLIEGNYGNGAASTSHNSLDHYRDILGDEDGRH